MPSDYVSILSKAVARTRNARERQDVYYRARNAVAGLRPGERLSVEQIAAEARALEAAIREIEDGIEAANRPPRAVEDIAPTPAELPELLRDTPDWRRVAVVAGVFLLVIGAAATTLWYFAGRNPRSGDVARAPVSADVRFQIASDLDPGVDGGSSGADLPFTLQRQVVFYRSTIVPGSLVVDRDKRYLYLIETDTSARRYGIGISGQCQKPGSLYRVAAKQEWPVWEPAGGKSLPGGPGNPLGARMLLLDQPELRIHGTNSPKTIGHLVASGCIRLVNEDIEHLYQRVSLDTRVIMRN